MSSAQPLFRTRVARRTFAVFVAAALLPVCALSLVSYSFVNEEVRSTSERQLRQHAKKTAMSFFERLTERERDLRLLVDVAQGNDEFARLAPSLVEELSVHFERLSLVTGTGVQPIPLEPGRALPVLSPNGGEPLALHVSKGGRVLLTLPLSRGDAIVAELDKQAFFGPEGGLEVAGIESFLVLDDENSLIFASKSASRGFREEVLAEVQRGRGERVTWSEDGHRHIAAGWRLFLAGRYEAKPWHVVVSAPKVEIFASAARFKLVFALVVLLCLGVVVLGSIRSIRRTLEPLAQLKAAAQAMAKGDFTRRVEISQGDEFGELAGTFDHMRAQIEESITELRAARDTAESASRVKSDFLAMMSHEIRTPMNGVLGMTELALTSDDPIEREECLESVRTSMRSLLGVVRDILDFASLERADFTEKDEGFDPSALFGEITNALRERATEKELALRFESALRPELRLRGDTRHLTRVTTLLLENALKFTERGFIALKVAAREEGAGRLSLLVDVEDSGVGIAAEELPTIFDPFTQVEGYMNRRFGGMGLGLATAKRLVDALGGKIEVTSTRGEGSRFHLELRYQRDVDVAEDVPAAATPESESTSPAAGARILVAEDNRVNQKVLARLLEKAGHQVVLAANGAEAFEAARRERFDIVLMDLQMPVINGLEATALIRADKEFFGTHLPILALTAHASAEDERRALAAGMDGFLTKPIHREELLSAIAATLAQNALPA